MSNQLGQGEFSKVEFRNLWAAVYPFIKSRQFMNIQFEEQNLYASIMQYRVERDLYELCVDGDPDFMTWKEFLGVLHVEGKLKARCAEVILRRLESASFYFDFTREESSFFKEDEKDAFEGDKLLAVKFLSDAYGTFLMELFLYFVEQAHFNHLRDTVRPSYRWEEYFRDLGQDEELWNTVLSAFRGAILRLDFKNDWLEVGLGYDE